MLGILAYMIVIILLYDFVGGFDTGQWVWIIVATIVGFAFEIADAYKLTKKDGD